MQTDDGRHCFQGQNAFKVVLLPEQGGVWNMEQVSVLGLMIKNTGKTDLVMDLMLSNDGATGWSNSALGRTVVKPGEELPLGVALCRSADYSTADTAYLRMSGRPNGNFRHWHTIDPGRVKNFVITCARQGDYSFELAQMFPLQKIDETHTGEFPFIDRYGQYIYKEWPGKVHSDKDLRKGAKAEVKLEAELGAQTGFTKYGGWKQGPRFEATGFFRTQKHEDRWWFVDPEGYLFWSYGVACVGVEFAGQTPTKRNPAVFQDIPAKDDKKFGRFHTLIDVEDNYELLEDVPHYDFTRANLYRKYGADWEKKSVERDIARLQYCHINTIGAWSDYPILAAKKVPYTVVIHYVYPSAAEKIPDPFDDETRMSLRKAIEDYPVPFKDDPWCLGVFVNNELHWANSPLNQVAKIFSFKRENTEAKKAFRNWLERKYNTIDALNAAWQTSFSEWNDLLKAVDKNCLNKANAADCSALTTLLAETFYKMDDEELERYSPNSLYLGSRMNAGCKEVVLAASKYADVISANVYSYSPNPGNWGAGGKPVLISEFHFTNISGGNLGAGLRAAQDAVQQARLFQVYMTGALNHPQIIGAHWFAWRDQCVGGRYDGENFDTGLFDITDRPNEELLRAAEAFGRNLYKRIN